MTEKLDELEKKLSELEEKIKETKKRLPAHSTKPPVMMDLLALEDEYDEVFKKIREIKNRQ
ncbi:MAG: hypothetical protein JRJ76_07575 [Deltaproteobacteria bacterium]|nr:hypothetical protein [Deltaproteobacteria bacterium]MBW1848822.1 hypothetical protein [Deltaproteobacteria bacterium]MBW2179051.1 hypothetical protein [Deltaproteobacteria bacterium]MBW2363578.1 hypothetical protein [Deltaproteobacteria bacterium]